uniref:Phospholipase A2-like central domain-containing protein n=1 Tax=Strigamia maritima TaxID=126957 RepID=T1IUI3_STRMM
MSRDGLRDGGAVQRRKAAPILIGRLPHFLKLFTADAAHASLITHTSQLAMRQVAFVVFIIYTLCTPVITRSRPPNLISQRVLNDGEVEKRIYRDGTFALETSVPGPGSTSQLRLWQVSNGRQFIQTILDSRGKIVDCEFSSDKLEIEEFISTFDGVVTRARVLAEDGTILELERGMNWTIRLTPVDDNNDVVDGDLLLDVKTLRAECKQKHVTVKARMAKFKKGMRNKRDVFIYPGTNWCGVGATTERYNELGFNAAADRCCRQHDFCSHIIEGFSSKYNIFNYRLHTISHCDCDER